jgi:TolB protein
MMKKIVSVIFGAGVISLSFAEKFDLEVYASKFDSIPVGVVEFLPTNGIELADNKPGAVIASDLDFCGKFHVASKLAFDSTTFANENIGIYIDGDYAVEGNSVTLNCNLRDVVTKDLIIGKKYKGETRFVRSLMHKYCNEIVEMLFGDQGIFESRFIYITASGSSRNVAVMDFDGHGTRVIANNGVINLFPAFTNKNGFIWTSYLKGRPNLYTGSVLDGSTKPFMASRGIETSPDVSPIDGTIAYASSKSGNLDIYTCSPDATGVKQLTVAYGVDTAPSWSPNGYQIAFTSDRSGNPQIYLMDADGANQRRITFETKYADSPAWSPKGDKVAFMAMNEAGRFDIWVISSDGSGTTQVTSMNGTSENPTWAPDGSMIAFTNSVGGKSDLYVVKPDGSRLRKVTSSGDIKMPDWSGY